METEAERIPIDSEEDEASLRTHAEGPLVFDTENPDAAFVCPNCGNVVAFVDRSILTGNDAVQCAECGAMNTV